MPHVELSTGRIEYQDTGGSGPILVLLHGLLMNGSLWSGVVDRLGNDFRCIVPTLPLGGHTEPMKPGADCSMQALGHCVVEFLDALDLRDVVLVGNDTGGALAQVAVADDPTRIAKLVLISCDAFDNLPPGLSGKVLAYSGKLSPFAFGLFMQQLRVKPMRRLPISFGWLTKRGDAATVGWLEPILTQREIRSDTVRILRSIFADREVLVDTAKRLPDFERPALVVWATQDRIMPPEHGRRLAGLFPRAQLVEIDDSSP